ncbi:LamG-like jellyroll fold domain-containing protein [Rathayibacter sp. KR2-224]|uniref:LamG-like jellyroll fold domain-containing protein n=1 Tax=Rathayibacter sp. KR2-224 TaxID=3400913 RepID=UPI003C0BA505
MSRISRAAFWRAPKTTPSTRAGLGRALTRSIAVIGGFAILAGGSLVATASASADPTPASRLVVNADQTLRPVTHVASGSLYGLATANTPSNDLVAPTHPNTFVQMAPGGSQLPNGEPSPAGDALVVAPEAAKAGAKVVVRMSDWYPNFPYKWVSWPDWLNAVDTQVKAVQASGASNISALAPWNEPDWTWNASAAGSFNDFWTRTVREIKSLDPTIPIQGPSYSDNISGMKSFLENAVATDTVPDIIAWHELESSSKIKGDIDTVTSIEKSLGITPRPIAIEEYATPTEVGVPGALVGYIAKFERYGVDNAELAFWNHYGTLGDTLTDTGGSPNGAYWLYTWYGAMSGDMVKTTPPSASGLDGAASVTADKKQLSVIFGGGSGSTAVQVNGVNSLHLGRNVDVKLEYTPSKGRTTPVAGPVTLSDTTYRVSDDGSITVPVVMNATSGYHLVISKSTKAVGISGSYSFTNANSSLALAPSGGSDAVVQADASESPSQRWTIAPADNGLYTITNQASGLRLAADGSDEGSAAVLQKPSSASAQLWQLIPDGAGHYKIANYDSGLVLGVTGRSTSTGAAVIQWTDGRLTSACSATGLRASGKIGGAVALCGNGEYVTMPNGILSGLTGDYTISTWVNPSADTQWSRVFDIGTGTNAYAFLSVNAGSAPRFAITTSGAGGEKVINGTSQLPLNTWSLLTVTVSGSTGTLYLNGAAVGTNTAMTVHPSQLGATTQNWIGRSEYNDPYLNAAVDDFNVYDRALSTAEVSALAGGQAGAGDVVHYAFDETGGSTAKDSSGKGQDATIVSNPTGTGSNVESPDQLWALTKG